MTNPKKGTILITSLWILAILSILTIGIGFRASVEARLAKYNMDSLRALYIAKAGMFKSLYRLYKNTNPFDSLYECGTAYSPDERSDPEKLKSIFSSRLGLGAFNVGYVQGGVTYPGMSDEERRININAAPQNVLEGLLTSVGEDPVIASDIVQWRSPGPGLDDGYYDGGAVPYKCKHERFSSPEELLLVKGVDQKVFNKIRNYVTIFGNPAQFTVNINTAPREVLSAIMMSSSVPLDKATADSYADLIISFRSGPDRVKGTKDDVVFTADVNIEALLPLSVTQAAELKKYFTTKSTYFRIESDGMLAKSKTAKLIICVAESSQGKVPTLKSYREY